MISLRRLTLALAVVGLAGCQLPPQDSTQVGFRGVMIGQTSSPETMAALQAANVAPAALPPAATDASRADSIYQNVQVLGHLSNAEFLRTMTAITNWVAPTTGPEAGCNYCHNAQNLASDEKYQKVVSRQMLRMTQEINGEWTGHVAQTGVTCYTCHRGGPVPPGTWYYTDVNQPLRHYLDRDDIRVQSQMPLRTEVSNRSSVNQAEYAYALMINMSSGLGVNCTFCHNSRAFTNWDQSPPQRLTALRGLRMVRSLNMNHMVALQDVWPAARHAADHLTDEGTLEPWHVNAEVSRGPMGDGAKLQCQTCHQGLNKPLYAAAMAQAYPGLYPYVPPPVSEATADTAAAIE
ncbi:MAG TPA: photosynthetic reaction center cytochrome PufC [Gemmatimonadales bacterium]|nr:photosynthetic reaction center cytochrome c subunit [Gemmatimonadota bacterium]MCB9505091.1 photosynthetic reaction center cytochrome c subunit [Gemmatimonadales bacterium]MCA9767303.1 photosynthetic reaction center cytochrome c subunit [Gemmatimonadota bacterium]MCB9517794.1 photosynthetic reaction center cytochrome c subunit [Gemmatimonadales bacterium]HPF60567.1 photosynthetic reaction center cytochrome PufC [Gemmatimonadales bacterium]